MLNQYNADWYRLKRSASFRNTIIGMVGLILLLAVIMRFTEPLLASDLLSEGKAVEMDAADVRDLEEALADLNEITPADATVFADEVFGANTIPFFTLPFIVTIFTADFSFMTYRNTLSYETDRRKVYLAKLALSAVSCLLLVALQLLVSWAVGGIVFGFGGFSVRYLVRTGIAALLLFPFQLASLCFGHCIAAFSKKTSATLMAFLVTLLGLSLVIEFLTMSSRFSWLKLFNWNTIGSQLLEYASMPVRDVLIVVASGLIVAATATALGISRYQKSDMA